jgi:hypothetical protein
MKETIFYLEGRGGMYLYHFFVYNLGGLYYILTGDYNNYNHTGNYDQAFMLEEIDKFVPQPSNKIQFPIKIHMKDILPFQREAFEIIKDRFELIEDLSKIPDYEIVSIYGEPCVRDGCSDNPSKIFPFLRNLFLEKMNFTIIPGKRIFITRRNSESQHYGVLRRSVINEEEFFEKLSKYGFEYIQLENYNTYDKIKLFMESEIIISPNSSALTLSLFANKNAIIIEILNKGQGVGHEHYINIALHLGLNYIRYIDIQEDHCGNFNIDCNKFEEDFLNFL